MKSSLITLLTIICTQVFAQRPAPDVLETAQGPVTIQPIKHGTLVLSWKGKTIYADPDGGAKAFEGLPAPDLILITDIHGDHFNLETLLALNTSNAQIIVPQVVLAKLPDNLKSKAVLLNNGQTINSLGVSVMAIPMYNLPEAADAKHTKGRGNGYVLKFGNKTVYISGDTSGIPEMRGLKNIDVAFVCMNLPYTMDINEAAAAVLDFKPAVVYPYHYRGQGGLADTEGFKKLVNAGNANIDVRLRNWYSN